MEPSPDAFKKNEPSSNSAEELVRLLLKLNSRLREKLSLSRKKKPESRQTEVMIIILTDRKEPARPGKPAPALKSPAAPDGWMEDLFAEIEGSSAKRRKTS
jgi:hypothetical protein